METENQTKHPAAKFFEENGWVKIEKVIDSKMAFLLYHHVQLAATRLTYLDNFLGFGNYNTDVWGSFTDKQAPGDFSRYGDLIFDSLMNLVLGQMEKYTGKKLVPTYTYHRLYTRGTELTRHKDRPSCEISTTMCLGYDIDNLDKQKYSNWNWPMYVGPKTGELGTKGTPITLEPGDMIIYRGCEVEHWREPYIGNNHAQVFLHYNEKDGKNHNVYDGRPCLGVPRLVDTLKQNYNVEEKEEDIFFKQEENQIVY